MKFREIFGKRPEVTEPVAQASEAPEAGNETPESQVLKQEVDQLENAIKTEAEKGEITPDFVEQVKEKIKNLIEQHPTAVGAGTILAVLGLLELLLHVGVAPEQIGIGGLVAVGAFLGSKVVEGCSNNISDFINRRKTRSV